jgi:phosphatidate cytidylyltransferase
MTLDNQGGVTGVASESATRNFKRRVASAVVLAPVVILAAYFGGAVFVALCALAAAAVLWEWSRVVARSAEPRILAPGLTALALAAIFIVAQETSAAIFAVAIGAGFVGVLVAAWRRMAQPPIAPAWGASGVVYAGIVLVCPATLRSDPEFGLQALLFLFATVWATDIFAYLIGRTLGGPLLWPRLSPNKTWSGAFGGLLGGVAAGIAVAYASGGPRAAIAGVLALVLSIVAQGGDLFESAIKRRFGVKDTSQLIPGHGGVMDRLDGFLVAALAAVLIGILRQGVAAPARGLLAW